MQCKVAKLEAPRAVVWERQEIDEHCLGETDLHCRTLYSAISPGTEVAAYVGMPPLRPGKVYPRLVGYCNVARVVSVGSSVTSVRSGDHVITHQSHRSAFVCSEDAVLCKVSASADLAAASTAYLFHLGYSALLKAEFKPGHNVAVIGLGPIGLAAVGLISASGGLSVGFSDQSDAAEKAMLFGAKEVYRKKDNEHGRFDIVITTSNSWDDWKLALQTVRHGGIIAVLGFPGRGEQQPDYNPLDSQYLYDKQLTIVASGVVPNLNVQPSEVRFTVKRNMEWIIQQMQDDKLPAKHLVSQKAPSHELGSLYERLAARESGLITAVLEW